MKNLGGIFTKCPKSFELQNPSGSDGGEEMVPLDFSHHRLKSNDFQSYPRRETAASVKELRKKFEMLSVSSKGPLLTLHGSVEEIQKDFFPVDFGCPLSPKGFESNLPETAQQVIRQIQEQNSRGRERALLVASPSMLSSVKRDENHTKDDGVICDLLLFNKELGGLHLFTLVNSGSKDQFLPYSHNTGKSVKESLVMNGGCYEKFYITCHVVPCERVGTEPLDKLSPNNRYPKEYNLQSSRGKIFKLLRSLVTVLAQFPSFLSNKEGLTFLNLLTKQQFQLLYEQIDEHRELWIHGAAGTGKTVVAVEFIRQLLRSDSHLRPGNILYVCENLGILEKVRKLNICDCLTRKAFMKGDFDFSFTKHVILDEVQNFRDEDGDWLGKARRVVRQHANDSECESGSNSTDSPSVCERRGEVSGESESDEESNPDTDSDAELDPECNDSKREGYLWSFLDRNQINHRFKTGIPRFFPSRFVSQG
ncbi:unnamed protein product [Porites lobata]|uniref:Schlafen group 3-like DNA/RNA helicase domain-containing protein n=1 Tax=Porites lobata TaxID=104759 RepID=A0ABN8QZ62_9CNID|nr:unnamed protein product [Porites lobata]